VDRLISLAPGEWMKLAIACTLAFQTLNNTLKEHEGAVMAIINDNYLMEKMEHIFSANVTFTDDLAKVGLALQPTKSKCYIVEKDSEMQNGMKQEAESQTEYSMTLMMMQYLGSQHAIFQSDPEPLSRATSSRRAPRSREDLTT